MTDIILYKFVFYCLSIATIVSAAGVVFDKNIVRAAFSLFFTLMSVAGLFAMLGADFLAGVQILLYAGGILVLILFGIMLTQKIVEVDIRTGKIQFGPSIIAGLILLFFMVIMILKYHWNIPVGTDFSYTTKNIGTLLLTDYLLPFEISSVALLAALIGAVLLARGEQK